MTSRSLNDSYLLSFNVRPIKHLYLVGDDDPDAMKQAILACSTQWGGMLGGIVPVKSDGSIEPLFEHYIRSIAPQRCYSYIGTDTDEGRGLNDKASRRLEALLGDQVPHYILGREWETSDNSLHAVAAVSDVQRGRYKLNRPYGDTTLSGELLRLASFGAIYPGQEGLYASWFSINNDQVYPQQNFWWDIAYNENGSPFSCPLSLTLFNLAASSILDAGLSSVHFDIVIGESVRQLCYFWNLRAVRVAHQLGNMRGVRVLMMPNSIIDDTDALHRLTNHVKKRFHDPSATSNLHMRFCLEDSTLINTLKSNLDQIDGVNELVTPLQKSFSFGKKQDTGDNILDAISYVAEVVPNQPQMIYDPTRCKVGLHEGRIREVTTLRFGSNSVQFNVPHYFSNPAYSAVGVDVEGIDLLNRYPRNQKIANRILYGKDSVDFEDFRLSYVGYVRAGNNLLDVIVPDEIETRNTVLSNSRYKFRESKISQYSDAVISLIGGIEGTKALRSPTAYAVLNALAYRSTKKIAQQIIKLTGVKDTDTGDFEVLLSGVEGLPDLAETIGKPKTFIDLKKSIPDVQRKDLLGIVETMSALKVIIRGYSLNCPVCGTSQWFPLDNVKSDVTCGGCFRVFPLPVRQTSNSDREIEWHYRLNSLFDRAMDLDVLPGLLAVYYLSQRRQCYCVTFGLDVLDEGKTITDLDFFMIANGIMCAGECKSGTRLSEKDLVAARVAAEIGCGEFYYCTTQEFEEESKTLVERLREEFKSDGRHMSLMILERSALLG